MYFSDKKACLVLSRSDLFIRIRSELSKEYLLLHAIDIYKADSLIRCHNVACIIFHVDGPLDILENKLYHIATMFPRISKVGIIESNNIQAACLCGNTGIHHVVSDCNIADLKFIIKQSINEKYPLVSWSDLSIDVQQCSLLVLKTLRILEVRYLKINSIQTICDDLGVVLETLSRDVKKYCKVGPKRLLMTLKIRHAVYLMGNPGMSLKEISAMVGYRTTRQFRNCFYGILGISPNHFRINYDESYFIELLHRNIRERSIISKKRC